MIAPRSPTTGSRATCAAWHLAEARTTHSIERNWDVAGGTGAELMMAHWPTPPRSRLHLRQVSRADGVCPLPTVLACPSPACQLRPASAPWPSGHCKPLNLGFSELAVDVNTCAPCPPRPAQPSVFAPSRSFPASPWCFRFRATAGANASRPVSAVSARDGAVERTPTAASRAHARPRLPPNPGQYYRGLQTKIVAWHGLI